MGDFTNQHNNVIQIGTGFEIQVIDGYSSGISAAVTSGGGTGYFVDPFQKAFHRTASKAVDIRMNDNVQLMGLEAETFLWEALLSLFLYYFPYYLLYSCSINLTLIIFQLNNDDASGISYCFNNSMTLTGTEHCRNQRKWKTYKRSITHSRKKCHPYRIFALGYSILCRRNSFEETFIIAGSETLRKEREC